jgi:hypothetical protein
MVYPDPASNALEAAMKAAYECFLELHTKRENWSYQDMFSFGFKAGAEWTAERAQALFVANQADAVSAYPKGFANSQYGDPQREEERRQNGAPENAEAMPQTDT